LVAAFRLNAQPKERLPRIGWLYSTAIKAGAAIEQGFLLGLREQGYIEGRNVLIERRWADGRSERIPALAAELVDLKVDVIYAPTPPDAFAAWQATRSIPIVFAYMGDPVGTGMAKSLARPGGNVTGLSSVNPELATKRYALLMEIAPKMGRVATLYDPGVHENLQFLEASRDAAKELGITIISVPARRAEDFAAVFDTVKRSSVDAILVIANPLFYSHRRRFTELAAETGLPAMYGRVEFVEDGGLIGYSIDGADQARRAAGCVARILKGANPSDLPIQQPTKFELHVNLKTARALGLTLPRSILVRADRVIE
jgi:putative ABC transport system substrate-binding protein